MQSQPTHWKGGDRLFFSGEKKYLLVVDYYSKYPEVVQVHSKTAETTIAALKSIFGRHGIPSEIIADNMPFNQWDFRLTTSSPQCPQSNVVERHVQTISHSSERLVKGEMMNKWFY